MNHLSIGELADITDGLLQLGLMPPLGGRWEPVQRIVSDLEQVRQGDVYWALVGDEAAQQIPPDEAYARGAMGIVADGRHVEPWAGGFSIRVDDARDALERLAAWTRDQFSGELVMVCGEQAPRDADLIHRVVRGDFLGTVSEPLGSSDRSPAWLLELTKLEAALDYALIPVAIDDIFSESPESVLCRPDIAVINCSRNANQSCLSISPRQLSLIESLGPDGWAVVYGDERSHRLARRITPQVISVGQSEQCDLFARDVRCDGNRLEFSVDTVTVSLREAELEHVSAALLALAAARLMNVSLEQAARRLATWQACTPAVDTKVARVA